LGFAAIGMSAQSLRGRIQTANGLDLALLVQTIQATRLALEASSMPQATGDDGATEEAVRDDFWQAIARSEIEPLAKRA
jgi:hypothetical protein